MHKYVKERCSTDLVQRETTVCFFAEYSMNIDLYSI
jgi:hypothetical protein